MRVVDMVIARIARERVRGEPAGPVEVDDPKSAQLVTLTAVTCVWQLAVAHWLAAQDATRHVTGSWEIAATLARCSSGINLAYAASHGATVTDRTGDTLESEGRHNRRDFLRYSALVSAGVVVLGIPRKAGTETSAETAADADGNIPNCSAIMLDDPNNRQGEFADVNGASIFYQMSGEGEPKLLIHGYPLSGALFSRVREMLSRHFTVITVDLRGYGMSTTPSIPDSIAMYAEDTLAVMDQLDIELDIIGGMSMGGPIALEMYQRSPERFSKLILIDTIATAATPAEAGLWRGTADMVEQGGIEVILPAVIPEMLTGDTRTRQPQFVNYLKTVCLAASVEAGIGGALALATRPDYMALLPQIAVPTLVLVGQEDTIYPFEISMMIQAAIPGSTLVVIPGAAHAAIFEAPIRSAKAIVDWVAGNPVNLMPPRSDEMYDIPLTAGALALQASLNGGEEVPGPGDPDGFGFADVFADASQRAICFRLSVSRIEGAVGAHIHEGGPGVAGPVVVPLSVPGPDGLINACVQVDAALASAIAVNPGGYSVNVHTPSFPSDAIRGQLAAV